MAGRSRRLPRPEEDPARASNQLPYVVPRTEARRRDGLEAAHVIRRLQQDLSRGRPVDEDTYRKTWYRWERCWWEELRTAYGVLIVDPGDMTGFEERLTWALVQCLHLGQAELHPGHDAIGAGAFLGSGDFLGGLLISAWQLASLQQGSLHGTAGGSLSRQLYTRLLRLFVTRAQQGVVRNHGLVLAACACLRHLSPPQCHGSIELIVQATRASQRNDSPYPPAAEEQGASRWIDLVWPIAHELLSDEATPERTANHLEKLARAMRRMAAGMHTLMMCPAFDVDTYVDLWACAMYAVAHDKWRLLPAGSGPPAPLCVLRPLR